MRASLQTSLFLLVLIVSVTICRLALADIAAADAAYLSGEYKTAVVEYKVLAEQGDAVAQHSLGHMYDRGDGVLEDDSEAVKWYRRAAEQRNVLAQRSLGAMYARGQLAVIPGRSSGVSV